MGKSAWLYDENSHGRCSSWNLFEGERAKEQTIDKRPHVGARALSSRMHNPGSRHARWGARQRPLASACGPFQVRCGRRIKDCRQTSRSPSWQLKNRDGRDLAWREAGSKARVWRCGQTSWTRNSQGPDNVRETEATTNWMAVPRRIGMRSANASQAQIVPRDMRPGALPGHQVSQAKPYLSAISPDASTWNADNRTEGK
ncbi:uncharacterized protein SPSK_10906 [Sporothrix schenckii 1099-18]|uniref:Uncharacterized protein n=1 Tax=Sporothrix schenckii 1099-18 TaxID=1397361 RepID=A0A0F2M6V3_SPOSC|nr:uncharacterized protein SPSK_10906 [Sporothrix schenckii 1099-18]KJR84814.1 hypothetical protein SPSK_10906 [Sporothrix schenckii 1099-18]